MRSRSRRRRSARATASRRPSASRSSWRGSRRRRSWPRAVRCRDRRCSRSTSREGRAVGGHGRPARRAGSPRPSRCPACSRRSSWTSMTSWSGSSRLTTGGRRPWPAGASRTWTTSRSTDGRPACCHRPSAGRTSGSCAGWPSIGGGGIQNYYARPIEGVVATVDMNAGTVIDVVDVETAAVAAGEAGVLPEGQQAGPARASSPC